LGAGFRESLLRVIARDRKGRSRSAQRGADAPPDGPFAPEPPDSLGRALWKQIEPFVGGVALALLIRALVLETFYVPSESMLSTLVVGDHVFVNKFVFGARIPFTDIRLPKLRDPQRGDVIVFDLGRKPGSEEICPLDQCPKAPSDAFIKRLIGLPGDRVEINRMGVFVNGARLEQTRTAETVVSDHGVRLDVLEEALPSEQGICRHIALDDPAMPGLREGSWVVPPGRYFMMGDNRDQSNDSRFWGFVPFEDVRGPAFWIYWSWNNREDWSFLVKPWVWFRLLTQETRWSRFGDSLSCIAD
jgi:signal peptidase I